MSGDIFNSVVNIIELVIIIGIAVGLLILAVKIGLWILEVLKEVIGKLFTKAITLFLALAGAVLIVMLVFMIYIGGCYAVAPDSLHLNLKTITHDFDIGTDFASVSGTYIDTDTGYIIRPTFGLPFRNDQKINSNIIVIYI
jgi:hypothetical protein